MQAGQLDQRISVERFTSTTDPLGQPIEEWAPAFTAWAAVEPLVGREYLAAQAAVSEVTAKIRLRYRPGVTSVADVRSGGRELVLMCKALA